MKPNISWFAISSISSEVSTCESISINCSTLIGSFEYFLKSIFLSWLFISPVIFLFSISNMSCDSIKLFSTFSSVYSRTYYGTGFFSGFSVPVPVWNRNRNRNRKTGYFPVSKIIKKRFYQVFDIPNNKFDFSLLFLLIHYFYYASNCL